MGLGGFEPPTSWSRTTHPTKLDHNPDTMTKNYQYKNVEVSKER